MNRDVLLSLLALDSYNRGYDPNVGGLFESGDLGDAKILVLSDAQDVQADWQAAGFYAIAYDMTGVAGFAAGETVISFRGTTEPDGTGQNQLRSPISTANDPGLSPAARA